MKIQNTGQQAHLKAARSWTTTLSMPTIEKDLKCNFDLYVII